MAGRNSDLAARFRSAIQRDDQVAQRQTELQNQDLEEQQQARLALLQEIKEFAEAIGFLEIVEEGESLTLRFREQYVHFEPMGSTSRVRVEFEGMGDEDHRLYREVELDNRWVWARRYRRGEDRLPLFHRGLEELFVLALGLPRPGASPPEEPGRVSPSAGDKRDL